MGILKIISVTYRRPIRLRMLCDCFRVQTDPRWELHVIHDGPYPDEDLKIIADDSIPPPVSDDKRIKFYSSVKRNQLYGHPNRKYMLEHIEALNDDFILMTNDDNYYTPNLVSSVINNATKTVGMIYWNMIHNYYAYEVLDTKVAVNNIDMGAFAVRADVAKAVGFNSTKFEADGIYCVECNRYCENKGLRVLKVKGVLFVHN